MHALPRPSPGSPLRLVPGDGDAPRPPRPPRKVAQASAWTLASMLGMSALRLVSQISLSYLCLPAHFGAVALMRTFLTLVEMLSDVGIRGAVVYHERGEEREFLRTAASVQLLRGIGMWLVTCALAWPAAAFYEEPLLLFLLPLAGFEAVNNGWVCVRLYVAERRLQLGVPLLLDLFALALSIATSVTWAWIRPGALALAGGPLVGGAAKALLSHWLYRAERTPLGWDRARAREIFSYGRWVIGGTMVSFVAQQFHVLYLGKFLPLGVLGVYQVAWNFCSQAVKPMTALANRVIIPHYAEFHRRSPEEHGAVVAASLERFLPACLLACVGSGLFAPALFGLFYDDSFADGGPMGVLFAVVVWFMVLQHVPRSALLSLGGSREVAGMALWNAGLTVAGIMAGFSFGGRSISGAILGNALGNVAGCVAGWSALRGRRLFVGRPMLLHSLAFLALLGGGALFSAGLVRLCGLTVPLASLAATAACASPLAWLVWSKTLRGRGRGPRPAGPGA